MEVDNTHRISIPSIEIVDMDAEDPPSRKCSLLYPNSKLHMSGKDMREKINVRKERKSSFATFLIVDEKNIGMLFFL